MNEKKHLGKAFGIVVILVALGFFLFKLQREASPLKATAASSLPPAQDSAIPRPPPSAASSAEARKARDAMREQILKALAERDAGAPKPPSGKGAPRAASEQPKEPLPRGHYEPQYIREHFREDMFPLLRQCYDAALERKPKLAGKLVLSFSIVGDKDVGGIVEDAEFAEESDLKDPEMETCVRESLMTLTFDKPPTGGGLVSVKYPVVFAPDEEPDAAR